MASPRPSPQSEGNRSAEIVSPISPLLFSTRYGSGSRRAFGFVLKGDYHRDDQVAALMALGVAVAVAISAHAPHQVTLPDFMALVGGLDISTHNEAAMYLVPELPGPVSREDSKSLPGSARLRD
jgi:hypothetical protein